MLVGIHLTERDFPAQSAGGAPEGFEAMKVVRTRIIVALASSAMLASGLSVAVAAVSSGSSAAVTIADGSSSGSATPNVTIVDP